jgi:hypothetical protein
VNGLGEKVWKVLIIHTLYELYCMGDWGEVAPQSLSYSTIHLLSKHNSAQPKAPSSSQSAVWKPPPVHSLCIKWMSIVVLCRGFLETCLCIVFRESADRWMRWLCHYCCSHTFIPFGVPAGVCITILLCSITPITAFCVPKMLPHQGIFQQGTVEWLQVTWVLQRENVKREEG